MANPSIVGSVTTFDVDNNATTVTFDVVVPSGADKVFACLSFFDGNQVTISAITFDSVAMTLIDEEYNSVADNGAWAYEIDAPSPDTYSFSVTYAGNNGVFQKRISISSLQNCTGFGATGTSIENSSTNFSAGAITSTDNDLAIGTMMLFPGPRNIDGDDTEISNVAASGGRLYTFTTVAGASTTTIASTCTSSSGVIVGFIAQGTAVALTASSAMVTAVTTMSGSATLNTTPLTASSAMTTAPSFLNRIFLDTFGGSGDLVPSWEGFQTDRVAVEQTAGRYRGNLTDNSSDRTLWFNTSQGRGDFQEVTFPFQIDVVNIGIGTQGDSQTAPSSAGSPFLFCGINIHVADLTSLNSSHMVIGHRGGTALTIEGKNTVSGSSTVTDEGASAAPLGRMDIRVEGTTSNTVILSYRAPGSSDAFTLYNGDGALPGTAPTYGNTVKVGIITYAQGTGGVPFVGTVDSFEINQDLSFARLNRKVNTAALIAPVTVMNGSATLNAGASIASGNLQASDSQMAATVNVIVDTIGDLQATDSEMAGVTNVIVDASGDLQATNSEMVGVTNVIIDVSGNFQASDSEMAGAVNVIVDASGDLQATDSFMIGVTNFFTGINASGNFQATDSQMAATVNVIVDASGDLQSTDSQIDASVNVIIDASGNFQSSDSQMAGVTNIFTGIGASGNLQASDSEMAGTVKVTVVANGNLQSSNSALQATPNTVIIFSGNLQATDSFMVGFTVPDVITPSGRIAIAPAISGRIAIVER